MINSHYLLTKMSFFIRKHSYQKDLLERFLGWFEKYVKGYPSDQ